MTPSAADHIAHGYTLTDIHRLARAVVESNRKWWPAGDRDDQYAAAWHGIVEHLYTTDDTPTGMDLMTAGRRTLGEEVRSTMRHHGTRTDSTNNGARHAAYWEWAGRATPSPETRIVETLAVHQILPTLTPAQRRALAALAATGDQQQASELLGVSPRGLRMSLTDGRRRFYALWHEGEAPSKPWGRDRRSDRPAMARLRDRARAAAREAA